MCVRGTTTPDQMRGGPSSVLRLRSPRFADHPIRSCTTHAGDYTSLPLSARPICSAEFQKFRGVNDSILPNIGGTNLELIVRRHSLSSQCEQPEHELEQRPILIVSARMPSSIKFCFGARKALCHHQRVPLGSICLGTCRIAIPTKTLHLLFESCQPVIHAVHVNDKWREHTFPYRTENRRSRLRCRYGAWRY